jgi:rhamnosyltransferase
MHEVVRGQSCTVGSSSPPKVAILLATYFGAAWIKEQLDSIFRNDGVNVHVFVSDDGSSDRTLEIIESYQSEQITILQPQKSGSAGQNFIRLLLEAPWQDFDYVSFCDQDDIWHKDKLVRAIDTIERNGFDAYSSNVMAFWPDSRSLMIDKAQPQQRLDYLFEGAGPGNTYVFTISCAKDLADGLHRADPASVKRIKLHDWLFYAMARQAGKRWFIDPRPSVEYRQHANNVFGYSRGWIAARRRLKMLYGDWYLEQVRAIIRISGFDGPERNFVERPSFPNLFHMLQHSRDYRRRRIEGLVLCSGFVWHAFSRL